MAEKLSPAQQKVLDLAALYPVLHGRAVVNGDSPADHVSIATARSLVKKGFLVEKDGTFELADLDADEQAKADQTADDLAAAQAEHENALGRLLDKIKARKRTPQEVEQNNARGMLRVFTAIETNRPGAIYQGTVPAKVKARRRAKGKVAKASRKANR